MAIPELAQASNTDMSAVDVGDLREQYDFQTKAAGACWACSKTMVFAPGTSSGFSRSVFSDIVECFGRLLGVMRVFVLERTGQ